jgi:hypothetical protein
MRMKLLWHDQIRWTLVVAVGVLASQGARAAAGTPVAAAPASKVEVKTDEIPRSIFVVPRNPPEGKDPFFPMSMRPYNIPQVILPVPTNATPVPIVLDIKLKGIAGSPEKPLALINNATFEVGEEGDVVTTTGRVRIKCLQIKGEVVLIQVGTERRELRMKPLDNKIIGLGLN